MSLIAVLAYNESKTVADIAEKAAVYGETTVMDDGSTDDTETTDFNTLRHPINLGGGAGFRTVATYAARHNYDNLITIDGDGEHDPTELPRLLDIDADLVIGSRFLDGWPPMPPHQSIGCWFYSRLTSLLTGRHITDATSCFRLYKVKTLENVLPSLKENQYYALEVLIKLAKNDAVIRETPIGYRRRSHGESKKGFLRYAWNLLRVAWEAA